MRSMCRRKACPSPRLACAPSTSPGMSASVSSASAEARTRLLRNQLDAVTREMEVLREEERSVSLMSERRRIALEAEQASLSSQRAQAMAEREDARRGSFCCHDSLIPRVNSKNQGS